MKKTILTLLIAAMVLAIPTNIFADETQETSGNSATVTLYASKASTYSVRLPQRVNVSAVESTFTVYAKGDIAASEELSIGYSGSNHQLTDTVAGSSKTPVPLTVNVTDPIFAYDDLGAQYGDSGATFTIGHTALQAGSYECVLPVTITLQSVSA